MNIEEKELEEIENEAQKISMETTADHLKWKSCKKQVDGWMMKHWIKLKKERNEDEIRHKQRSLQKNSLRSETAI